jgi:fructose-specific phosphotransferase system IIC component
MPSSFNVSDVNWTFVALLALVVFISSLLGNLIAFRSRFLGAILAGVIAAAVFVVWNNYPHNFPVPTVKTYGYPPG